ncbi:hypothetical protein [Rhodohalobacter sulfatireducens]|uniref:Lipoprotein n=1 Tax=Rhodohalobacter sulfatireducens TaxID=2911366 RepID=A0ABS9KCB8_9BACT|nr:hypothetical protein [Rhodohalobacter sulfatireducens]MCG2588458.1 hypothetical protein [Rhodohalobacter sulfatireducens]
MKVRKYIQRIIGVLLAVSLISSCGILDSDSGSSDKKAIGGDPTPMGAVGNSFDVPAFPGVENREVEITASEDGISTIRASAKVTDETYLTMAEAVPYLEVNGDVVSVTKQARITSKGIQQVYEDGDLHTVVNYDAKKGDTYKANKYGQTITRKVMNVSNEDDFMWGFMMIKTIQIEETGRGIPGVSKIVYYANHRFGIVGFDVHFEDGSVKYAYVYSDQYNE